MPANLSGTLGTLGFALSVLITTLPAYAVAKVGLLVVAICPSMRMFLTRLTYRMLNVCWWLTLKFCCLWVQIRLDGINEFRNGINASAGKPRVIIINHVSFLDSFITLGSMPFSEIAAMKTIASSHLFKMPVIGAICKGCGHLCVPFKSQGDGDFSVDKEKVAEVQQELERHVAAGNIGGWYPEGTLNKGDSTKLQMFRAGGFALPAKVDCEIWCIAHVGNGACWPAKAAMGGKPSKIQIKFFRLCESSAALLKDMPQPEADQDLLRAQSLYLAQEAQRGMQSAIDDIVSHGWASIPAHQKAS